VIGDPQFSLPYWNWSAKNGPIPDPFYDLDFLNVGHWKDPSGAASPNWAGGRVVNTVGSRRLTKGRGLQDDDANTFTQKTIDAIQHFSVFTLFTGRLEGSPHNIAHGISGGSAEHMGNGMSPLDPIFWLHHCNIDRIWAQWQSAGNSAPALAGVYDGQFVDAKGNPVTASSASALDFSKLNYTYDTLSPSFFEPEAQRFALKGFEMQKVLQAQQVARPPQTLAILRATKRVDPEVESRFTISVKGLIPSLFGQRTYWASNFLGTPRLAAEPARLLARFSDFAAPETDSSMVVKAFVNCPYLSANTPSDDPHYAGSFAFFEMGGPAHRHAQFVVDISDALRASAENGEIATEQVDVQLMAVPLDPVSPKASFSVGSVENVKA
jgi:tyrosinase